MHQDLYGIVLITFVVYVIQGPYLLKNHYLFVSSFLLLLLLLGTRGWQLFSAFGLNMANTAIYKSFSQAQTDASSRQQALSSAVTWLGLASYESELAEELPMIPASFRGLYYHRLDDWINAANWYDVAARTKQVPERQKKLLISPWMKLAPSGDFTLEAVVDKWHIRSDTAPGAILSETALETLEFSCSEIVGDPKRAILEWNEAFDIPYHHALIIRAKTEIGTRLILATVIDGKLVRHFVETGTGEWEDYVVSLDGDHIKYIYVQIREDFEASKPSCLAEIDSLTFLLDK